MIDTIRVLIPIARTEIAKVRKLLATKLTVVNKTGEITREFVTGPLRGSWDYKISVSIVDKVWEAVPVEYGRVGKIGFTRKVPMLVDSVNTYLRCEFSLPKYRWGINFLNTTLQEDLDSLDDFRVFLSMGTRVLLPNKAKWIIERIDVGFNFRPNGNIVDYYRNKEYSRREIMCFGSTVCWPGTTTFCKLYDKDKEYRQHDAKRLRNCVSESIQHALAKLVRGVYRFEVSIKRKKIKADGLSFGNIYKVEDIMKTEIKRIDQGVRGKVNRVESVIEKVMESEIKGISKDSVISVWLSLSKIGKRKTKQRFGKNKYYRALKVMKQLGIGLGRIKEAKVVYLGDYIADRNMSRVTQEVKRIMTPVKVANIQ